MTTISDFLLPETEVVGEKGEWYIWPVTPYDAPKDDSDEIETVDYCGPYDNKQEAEDDLRGLRKNDRANRKGS